MIVVQKYITELSQYAITGTFVLFTLFSFWGLVERVQKSKTYYVVQCLLIFMLQALLFVDLALVSRDMEYVFFYVFVQVFLLISVVLVPVIYDKVNRVLLGNMCMMIGIGMCMVSRLSFDKAIRQYIIVLVSLAMSLTIPWFICKLSVLKKLTWLYCFVGLAFLSAVLVLGEVTHGSKISFTIGEITFQPSEFIKIFFLFFLAGMLWEKVSYGRVVLSAVFAGAHVIVLVLSKDLGSALVFFVGYVFVVFAATGKYLYLLLGVLGGSGAAVIAYQLFGHVQTRVLAWLDPWAYIDSKGYAVTQSLFAVGSGSWFGMGLLQGDPSAIPYVEADFIFSSVSEELGTIFGVCLILLTLCSFIEMMKIAGKLRDKFYRLVVYGIGVMYLFQIFLTVGGGLNLIPLTGVTLPFISYGGSSCMTTMFMFFVVQGAYIGNIVSMPMVSEDIEKDTKLTIRETGSEQTGIHFCKGCNHTIYTTCVLFSAVFVTVIVKLCNFVATSGHEMINNSYNSRQEILLSRNYRGSIYSAEGEVLAVTTLDEAQKEERIYPYGELFSHVVGYSVNGRMGVEALANSYLIHTNTSLANKAANDLAGMKNPGDNVYTTLHLELQKLASSELDIYRGAVVITEVKTGKILAMVSHPDFDPNEIEDIWEDLVDDNKSSVLLNRVTQGLYPPGSTFKIVTALEYIRENKENFRDYSYNCVGYFKKENNRINCYHGSNHGNVSFARSFAKSCNSSFVNIGLSLDRDLFRETLDNLLFDRELPITLLHSESNVESFEEMGTIEMMQTAIGQGRTQITPMHLNMITCAIANKGVLMKPYVIDRVENDAGVLVKQFKESAYGNLMTEEEAGLLTELMTEVVEHGTASKLSGKEYTAAGKTGSAEYDEKGNSHAWFTGFAPVEDPEICITIIVEGAGSGGDFAVPAAARLFDSYFESKNKYCTSKKIGLYYF